MGAGNLTVNVEIVIKLENLEKSGRFCKFDKCVVWQLMEALFMHTNISYTKSCSITIVVHKTSRTNYESCIQHLQSLRIPFGCEVEVCTVEGSTNVAAVRQLGMKKTVSDIKIYLCDTIWLTDADILDKIIYTFKKNEQVLMIGIIGTNDIPTSGIAQDSWHILGTVRDNKGVEIGEPVERLTDCLAVYGCFMALKDDVDWHPDVFENNLFYDTALTVDLRRKGYRTVIIPQSNPAIMYDETRRFTKKEQNIFLEKYSKDIFPLVSVIIPTYCRPNYLQISLESALNQTYKNIEVFITDNSPDERTAELVKKYYTDNPKVKYEHHPELKEALGNWLIARQYNNEEAEYVQWLMDDDVLLPEKIAVMIDYYRANPNISLVTSYRKLIDANGKELPDQVVNSPIVNEDTLFSGKEIGRGILTSMFNFIGEPTTVLIRKKFLCNNDLGWTDQKSNIFVSDFPTWLNLCEQGDVLYLRKAYSMFRVHGGNEQNSLNTIFVGTICWANMIIYAWKRKIFLENTADLDKAVVRWFVTATHYLDLAHKGNIVPIWDEMFRCYFRYMSDLLLEAHCYSLEEKNEG